MNAVTELHLIIPGACGPLAEVQSLQNNQVLKRWIKVLSRSRSTASADNLHDVIKSVFNLAINGDLPTAALLMHANQSYDSSLNYLHADPVHLRADLDHAVLTSSADLSIMEYEAEQLCAALNSHFNQDGVKFIALDNDRWILTTKDNIKMTTTPLVDAVARNINFILPQGEGAGEWKQFLTEAQMLMHAHEVNVTRENAGHQSINSIWFHGSGKLPEMTDSTVTSVYSNHDLFKGLAAQIKCDFAPLPNSVNEYMGLLLSNNHSDVNVLHISELEHLTNYTDVSIWLERLAAVLDDWVYPLLNMAKKNNIKIVLYPCNNKQYQFSKYDALKFWRQTSLDQHVTSYSSHD